MWCVAPLEMNEGNSLGARVQSAYRLQCRKGPTRDLHTTVNTTITYTRFYSNMFRLSTVIFRLYKPLDFYTVVARIWDPICLQRLYNVYCTNVALYKRRKHMGSQTRATTVKKSNGS